MGRRKKTGAEEVRGTRHSIKIIIDDLQCSVPQAASIQSSYCCTETELKKT